MQEGERMIAILDRFSCYRFIRILTGIFLFSTIFISDGLAQIMISATGKPAYLVICGDDGTFSLQIANTTGGTMTGAMLTVSLPSSTLYTAGSVTGASEFNITNLNQPVFSLPSIPNNSTQIVTYDASIICGYTNTQNFTYTVTYNSQNYNGYETPLQNFYFPDPVITAINPVTLSIPVNSIATRTITIQQQGTNASTDTLILLDQHTSDVKILSVNPGVLHPYVGPGPLEVDTIIFTGSSLPGGNDLFDPGEVITVTETVKLAGCTNGQSTLKTTWGCYGQYCLFNTAYAYIVPASGSPAISMTFTANKKGWGFVDNKGYAEFTVTNTGTGSGGTAYNLVILSGFSSGGSTYYPNANWINKIDSFYINNYRVPANYSFAAGAMNGQYAFYTTLPFTSDPDGTGNGLEDADGDGYYDDLPAGKSFTIRAITYYSWNQALTTIPTGNICGSGWTNSAWQAFRFGYQFNNQCSANSGVNWIPNGNLTQFMTYSTSTLQTSISPDLYNGITDYFDHTVNTSTSVDNEGCSNDSVIYRLVFPHGVGISAGYNATFKGVGMGSPVISGDTAWFFLNKNQILTGGLFHIPVIANCALSPPSTGIIHAELKFWCDKTNYRNRFFTYWCGDSPLFGIQCPSGNCNDPSTTSVQVKRLTYGWTDNTCSVKVNASSPGIRLDNGMSGDSIKIQVSGSVGGTMDSLYIQISHNAIGGAWGNQLFFDVLADTLSFYDRETNDTLICANLSPQVINGTTSYLVLYLGNLTGSGGCLQGIAFTKGDKITYTVYGKIKNIAQTEWRNVPAFRSCIYWKDQNIKRYCNDLGVTFNVLGSNYPFSAGTYYQQIVLQGCNSFLYEGLINRTLDVCGGNPGFPSEVRPLYVIDTMNFTLPEGFLYQTGSARHTYFLDNGSTANEIIADPNITVSAAGTVLRFFRTPSWHYTDNYDCWNNYDRIVFNATPSCKATGNYNYLIDARGRNQFYVNGQGVYQTSNYTKNISYTPPAVTLTKLIGTTEGREDTVYWKISLCNSRTFTAINNWIGFESQDNMIQIVSVIDITNPAAPVNIPISGYGPGKFWAQTGSLSGNACRIFQIRAVYSTCNYDSILIKHGYNCAGYPMNPELGYAPSGYLCNQNSSFLYLDPKPISLNLTLSSPINPVDLCDSLEYEALVTNAQVANAYNLRCIITLPPGINILPGTSGLKYPYDASAWQLLSDPVNLPPGSNKWVYNISSDPNGTLFLKGSDSVPQNGYRIRYQIITTCDFTSGRSIKVTAVATNACGAENSRSSSSDPVLIYGLPTNVNLYVISTTPPAGFHTCDGNSLIRIKIINLGPSAVSNIEELGVNIADAFDYVRNSLTNIHNGPSGMARDTSIGGIRYINFTINPNLPVNDSIVFTFELHDTIPSAVTCDTIQQETTTLLVAQVPCSTAPGGNCLIHSVTSAIQTFRPVIKDHLEFGSYTAFSTLSGSTGENISIRYTLINTGSSSISSDTARIVFVHDLNLNGQPDENGIDSLYSQNVNISGLMPGDSIVSTAIFTVNSDKICHLLGGARLSENGCICQTEVLHISNIHLFNAGPDISVCTQTPVNIGMPATNGYSYIWVPATYLNSYTTSNPVFTYPILITQPDSVTQILTTSRPGNCYSRDTMKVYIQPISTAYAGRDSTICSDISYYIADASCTAQQSVLWTSNGDGSFNNPSLIKPVYTPGPADMNSGSVILTMNVTGYCSNSNDAMVLTVRKQASVFAGSDSSVCRGNSYILSDASASNYIILIWSTDGDGTFSDINVLHPAYSPGPNDIASGSAQLVLTATAQSPCQSIADTILLTVKPLPSVTSSPFNRSVCSGNSSGIYLTADIPGTTFSWTASGSSPWLSGYASGAGPVIDQILVNSGTNKDFVTYIVTPVAEECTGFSRTYTDTVIPIPVLTPFPVSSGICSDFYTDIQLLSDIPYTNFSWNAIASSDSIKGYGPGNGSLIHQQLRNTGYVIDSVTYTISPEFSGCYGESKQAIVKVYPFPDLSNSSLETTICSGTSTGILLTSHISGTLFSWTASASSGNITGYSDNLNNPDDSLDQTLHNHGIVTGTVTYTITPHANGCDGGLSDFTVYVLPEPVLSNSPAYQAQCSGNNTSITLNSVVPGTLFTWRAFSKSGLIAGFSGNPGPPSGSINQVLDNSAFVTDTAIYRLRPTCNNCWGDSADYKVTVFPIPDAVITPSSQTICSEEKTALSLTSHVAGAGFAWTVFCGNPGISGYSNGNGNNISQLLTSTSLIPGTVTYTVYPTANSCPGTNNQAFVNVNPVPAVTLSKCFDVITSLNASPVKLRGGIPLNGSFSGKGVSGNYFYPSVAGVGSSFLYYSFTNNLGCTRKDSLIIQVRPAPLFTCGTLFTDIRDGRKYPTFIIPDGRCWFAANLNYGDSIISTSVQTDNCHPEKYCTRDIPQSCNKSGGVYQWDELMQYDSSELSKGLCPPGWHIPSATEWDDLLNAFMGASLAGGFLKDTIAPNNFHGYMTGLFYLNSIWWVYSGFYAGSMYWTSTAVNENSAIARGLNLYNPSVSLYRSSRANSFNIRCIRN